MQPKKQPNSGFREYLLLHPAKRRHERLVNLISKNRGTDFPETLRTSREESNWEILDQNKQFLKLMGQKQEREKTKQQLQMRHTKFMGTDMQRLKKQRKRQERRKFSYNPLKQVSLPKKQSTSMYIFLPIVSKHSEPEKDEYGKNRNTLTTITTVDLFGDRKLTKMKKCRAYSLDEKYRKLGNEEEEQSYELKVQQVIQDIKNNRHNKPYKIQGVNFADQNLNKQFQLQPTQTIKADQKIEQGEKKMDEKKTGRPARTINFTVKRLEPWVIHSDQLDNHLIPQDVGIQSFQFS